MSIFWDLFSRPLPRSTHDSCFYCRVTFAPGELAFGPIGPNADWDAHWDCWRRANPAPDLDRGYPPVSGPMPPAPPPPPEPLERAIERTKMECLEPGVDHDHSTPPIWKQLQREGYR